MYFLIILLFIIILVPTLILSLVSWVLSLFGFRPKRRWGATFHTYSNGSSSDETPHRENSKDRKKIFAKDEGEYVDFEEIKEDDLNGKRSFDNTSSDRS